MSQLIQNSDFDRLLREKLSNAEATPSPQVWNNIASSLPKAFPQGTVVAPAAKLIIGSSIIISIVVISTFVYFSTGLKKTDELRQTIQASDRNEIIITEFMNLQQPANLNNTDINKEPLLNQNQSTKVSGENLFMKPSETANHEVPEREQILTQSQHDMTVFNLNLPIHLMEQKRADLSSFFKVNDKINPKINFSSSPEFYTGGGIYLGAFWQPEVNYYDKNLFYPSVSKHHSFGLSVIFAEDEFFVETGVEAEFLNKNNIYKHTTITNELIGQYEHVDSVVFTEIWDPLSQTYVVQPQYFTSIISVYEQHLNENVVEKKDAYTYLRIPILIGFQRPFRKLNFETKTGFVFHSLVFTTEKEKEFFEIDENYLLYSEQSMISFERTKQYWSFVFYMGLSYPLYTNTRLFILPSYRYMLSPIFTGNEPSRKSPYAFGVASGIRYTF